jgi:hypothetical protein
MGFLHQQLVEILSYALVLTENHIFTSGATGTNAAVIRGALRAERPDLLTVVLPQSLSKQPEVGPGRAATVRDRAGQPASVFESKPTCVWPALCVQLDSLESRNHLIASRILTMASIVYECRRTRGFDT